MFKPLKLQGPVAKKSGLGQSVGGSLPPQKTPTPIEAALREKLEDQTEVFLLSLYDAISPRLANHFQRLTKQGAHELAVLANLASSLGVETAAFDRPASAPAVDRVVWRQVARSSSLALFDALLQASEANAAVGVEQWATWCVQTVDFERFRRETSLNASDAKQALSLTAVEILRAEPLQRAVPLFYRDRYVTLIANRAAESIRCVPTHARPLAWLEIAEDDALLEEGNDRVRLCTRSATGFNMHTLDLEVHVSQNPGQPLVMAPVLANLPVDPASCTVALDLSQQTRVLKTVDGYRVVSDEPELSFSVSRHALSPFSKGFLLVPD